MLSLFLGAGFSKWAVNLPVANELFDYNTKPFGPREKRKLETVKVLKANWDSTHPEGLTEQFISDALKLPLPDRKSILWYITRRLSDPFIWVEYHSQRWRRHVLMIDENRKSSIQGVVKARNFLQGFSGFLLEGIITTNYDMLVEYALGTRGFNYGVPNQTLIGRGPYPLSCWNNPVRLTGKTKLAKIHGSISWDNKNLYSDGRCGLTGNALIVPPTQEKILPPTLKFAWKLAESILKRSTHLMVFGFSFNSYDEPTLVLLKSARGNLESIILVDVEPKVAEARKVWPNALISVCMPPPEGQNQLHNWKKLLTKSSF